MRSTWTTSADVDPGRVILTASTSEAYSYLFKLLTDPGEEVLVPRPSYPVFEYLAAMESVSVRPYPLRYDGAWHIDFPALEKAAGSRTRAIAIVNPNNPTGSYLKKDEWARLAAWAASGGVSRFCPMKCFRTSHSHPTPIRIA